jgi:hypothetical protein
VAALAGLAVGGRPEPVATPAKAPAKVDDPPRVAKAAEPQPAPKAERPAASPEPPQADRASPAAAQQHKAAASKPANAPPPARPTATPPERTAAITPAPAPKAEPPPQHQPPTGFWRDQGITTKVASKLQFNRRLWRTGIQVETREGVVTLRGNVPSQGLIDEAVKITREVYGVRAVRNELKIGQPDYSSTPGSGG